MSSRNSSNHTYIPELSFDSPLTNLIIDLDALRSVTPFGTTPSHIFAQLKYLFHILESIESARIEGNRTTIAEVMDYKQEHGDKPTEDERFKEIFNIEKALKFIDENVHENNIDASFISHLHTMVVDGLEREGSKTPGTLRLENVSISGSAHTPPEGMKVPELLDDLISFINTEQESKYDLLKIAISHHRFAWIHPFDNGNGRMARLVTYAMLIKFGFPLDADGRIINPTGLFCSDRNKYYEMLSDADQNGDEGIIRWCIYVLGGIKEEVGKVKKLTDYKYLSEKVLMPSIEEAKKMNAISRDYSKALLKVISKQKATASDIRLDFEDYYPEKISRMLKKMIEEKLIRRFPKNDSRTLVPIFINNSLMRFVINQLFKQGYLVDQINDLPGK